MIVTSAPVILMEPNTLLRLFDDAHDNLLHPTDQPLHLHRRPTKLQATAPGTPHRLASKTLRLPDQPSTQPKACAVRG